MQLVLLAAKVGDIDLVDSLVYVTIVLFILSAITEKVTQLVRCYPKHFQIISIALAVLFYGLIIYSWYADLPKEFEKSRISSADGWLLIVVNTFLLILFILNFPSVKKANSKLGSLAQELAVLKNINTSTASDSEKTRDVSLLSFIVGFVIAYLFNASLIELFAEPGKPLKWELSPLIGNSLVLNSSFFGFDIKIAAGFLITGFFLAFGSKFFHDLLDTLLQVKNLKRKLNEEATYEAADIEQFDEYIAKSSGSIINLAIEQNSNKFKPELLRISPLHGRMLKNGNLVDCIDVHLKGDSKDDIPSSVDTILEKGQRVTVPVNVIYSVEIPTVASSQGDVTSNQTAQNNGVICCQIQNHQGKKLLLTCSHVLNDGKGKNNFGTLTTKVPAIIDGKTNGDFIWAMRSDKLDIALIEAQQGDKFTYEIPPKKERALTPSDMLTTTVKIVRQNKVISTGTVVNHKFPGAMKIAYADGEFGLVDLIILSQIGRNGDDIVYTGITDPGDSGAGVYDQSGHLIGMIIAGNSKFSYATSMPEILTKIKSTIILNP